jgi:hypothetical protein
LNNVAYNSDMHATPILWLLLTLLVLAIPAWAGKQESAVRANQDNSSTFISYEVLLQNNEDEQTRKVMQHLGEQYLDKLVEETKPILEAHFSPEEIYVSDDGDLARRITIPAGTKDLLTSLYTKLTKTYSGRYLPVGSNILYISLPSQNNGSVAVKVNISGLATTDG